MDTVFAQHPWREVAEKKLRVSALNLETDKQAYRLNRIKASARVSIVTAGMMPDNNKVTEALL